MKLFSLSKENADYIYAYLSSIPLEAFNNSVKSKKTKQITRLGKNLTQDEFDILFDHLKEVLEKLSGFSLLGGYVNKYVDGKMWAPNHSHKGTWQIVFSFGASRDFCLGKRKIKLNHGDCILFGSTTHGVPIDETCTEERFSIAFFLNKL